MEELHDFERYLRGAAILTWGDHVDAAGNPIDGGHPEKHRVVLAGGVEVLAKPGFGPHEPVVRREAAGWAVAKFLGFTDLIAATVLREVPRLTTGDPVLSSVQVTLPDRRDWLAPLSEFSEGEIWRAAVFDAVVAHTDHANNNWFGVYAAPACGGGKRLRLVDTGNAFGEGPSSVNSSFYAALLDNALPDEIRGAVRRMVESWPPVFAELLGSAEATRVEERARQLAASGVLRVS